MVGYRSTLLLSLLVKGYQATTFSNVTLTANNGDLSVVIYLPQGIKPEEKTYYVSSRFEHGSMIGSIKRKTRNLDGTIKSHTFYGTNQWRVPHDPYWTESGVGLASEFGVGDDGAFCNYRCGWFQANEVTNGVLGYLEAKNGDSFLKLGVGELIKGTCNTCDSTDDFKFNSPYQFAKTPIWTLEEDKEGNSIALQHQAVLNEHGYHLRKDITLNDDELLVKTTLTNVGRVPFASAWYSHHLFTCDSNPVDQGYSVDLDLTGTGGNFDEPGTWSWSEPLRSYAQIKASKEKVTVQMDRGLERDVKIKAEFVKDESSVGAFTLRGCGTAISETIPEVGTEGGVSMYAFNLYIESGTISPEPQIYMHLYPGQSISWTQKLEFNDDDPDKNPKPTKRFFGFKKAGAALSASPYRLELSFVLFTMISAFVTFFVHRVWRGARQSYSPIPDHCSAAELSEE